MASYIAPGVRDKFESLSIDLKNMILEQNVRVENLHDLIHVLEKIVNDAETDQHVSAGQIHKSADPI